MIENPVFSNATEGISTKFKNLTANSESQFFSHSDASFDGVCEEPKDHWLNFSSPIRLNLPEQKPDRYQPYKKIVGTLSSSPGLVDLKIDNIGQSAKKCFFKGGFASVDVKRYNFPNNPGPEIKLPIRGNFHISLQFLSADPEVSSLVSWISFCIIESFRIFSASLARSALLDVDLFAFFEFDDFIVLFVERTPSDQDHVTLTVASPNLDVKSLRNTFFRFGFDYAVFNLKCLDGSSGDCDEISDSASEDATPISVGMCNDIPPFMFYRFSHTYKMEIRFPHPDRSLPSRCLPSLVLLG